jgi:hypothetical protein
MSIRSGLLRLTVLTLMLLSAPAFIRGQEQQSASPRIVETPIPLQVRAERQSLTESVPADADYRAPILGEHSNVDRAHGQSALNPSGFHQTMPGFRLIPECGIENPQLLRLQISSDEYYQGPQDGGTLDLTHQLLGLLPDVQFLAAIQRKHLPGFLKYLHAWNIPAARLTLCPQDLPVAQWAQDNGKGGRVRTADGKEESVLLVPRYASRGEINTTFAPGESFLADSLVAAGLRVVQSPLLFQGGNLLAVFDPLRKQTILLIGEAEIHRNAVPGFGASQVLDAFRIEFGVDQCVVLPAVSFHIDYEVSARVHDGKVIAFVNDPLAAHRMVLDIGVGVLLDHGAMSAGDAKSCRAQLAAGQWTDAAALLDSAINRLGGNDGHFPLSVAQWFSRGPSDSGVGNLLRLLASHDYLSSLSLSHPATPDLRSHLQSIRNTQTHRESLIAALRQLGWIIVPIPSTSDDELSLNYLNGLQLKGRYLMPEYGGLLAPLDQAAMTAFQRALPGIEVVGVNCGESQRRNGALHCSVSVQ